MIDRADTQARRQESQIAAAEEEPTRDCRAKYVTGVRETKGDGLQSACIWCHFATPVEILSSHTALVCTFVVSII